MSALERLLAEAVGSGALSGVAVAVGDAAGTLAEAASGERAPGAAMAADTVCWIASMTKAVTTTAALQQVERGRLALDTPIAAVLPELAAPQVLEGYSPTGAPLLRPARRAITLRHLLTHSSGFSYNTWNADIDRYMVENDIPGTGSCQLKTLTTPLVFDPGEAWEYGIGIDWAGRAVEAVTGRRLREVLAEDVLGPLGMVDTGFQLGAAQRARLARMHRRAADGGLAHIPFELPQAPEFDMGGGGLYGTARDYLRFCRMWLNGGSLDGARVLSPAMVAEASRDSIATLAVRPMITAQPARSNDLDLFPGMRKGWGLSFLINEADIAGGRAAGSLAWAGLANTYYWIDPQRGRAGVLTTQVLPFADPRVLDVFAGVERLVYAGAV
jgi:methyl acetate hydrolase